MPVPLIYRKGQDTINATYDYVDVADGAGYVKFLGTTTSPAGILNYHLIRNVVDCGYTEPTYMQSHERRTYILNNIVSGAINFVTSPMNTSRVIKGTAHAIFTLAALDNSSNNYTLPVVTLKKNSEILGVVSGANVQLFNSKAQTYSLNLDLPETTINSGDTLTLQITLYSTASVREFILHDPLNRDVTSYTVSGSGIFPAVTAATNQSELSLYIPFKIDV